MEPQMQMPQGMPQAAPEDMGRGTDTVLAHMSLGEVVIPRAFLDDPDVMQMLQALFAQNQADIAEFTVGDPANKINPETGYPEFGFFKSLGKIFKVAAPLALSYFLPGLGSAIGSGILGAGAAGASTLGSALVGGATGALTGGGLKGALQGAALGGVGANIGNVGSSANPGSGILGAAGKNIPGLYDVADSVSGLVGTSAQGQGPTISGAPLNGGGTGIKGAASSIGNSLSSSLGSSLTGGATGGGSSFSPLSTAANIFGGLNQDAAIKKQQKQLLGANQEQLANLETFDPSGITSDPGYAFNLEQGQEGLNKQLAASGALGSGRAIKAATEYNQNYANNAFQSYYQRWLQKTQGKNAIIGNSGDVRAQATGAGAQNLSQSLSNALGAKVGGYGGDMTLEQLRRLGMAV